MDCLHLESQVIEKLLEHQVVSEVKYEFYKVLLIFLQKRVKLKRGYVLYFKIFQIIRNHLYHS